MNYIVTNRKEYFQKIGNYNYCQLSDMILPKTIAYDSETTGIKFYKSDIFAIQIGTGENNYLIDIESIEIENVIPYLKNKILVIHNALFDLTFLYKHNFFPWKVRDTLLARKIIHNGIVSKRHDFGTVMEEELSLKYDKSEQKNIAKIKLSTAKAIQYCFNDVDQLLKLANKLHKQIISEEYLPVYNLHCRWIRACAYMQCCGVPINEQKWLEKCNNDKKELKQKESIVKEYISNNLPEYKRKQLALFSEENELDVLLSSPQQMIPVFEKLGINVQTEEGKSISEDVIKKTKHPFVDIWLDYQGIKHDVTTFGENFLGNIWNGRLYTSYKPILDTARISAGGKNKDKNEVNDINTLNIPANQKSRQPFEAKPGYDYIVSDYSGQETVTGADITGDKAMIESIVNKSCLHCAFARVLYPELAELSDEEIIKNHKDKRTKSKAPRFCFQFGGTAFTLALNEGISLEEANYIENSYKQLHTGIYEYGNKKLEEAIKLGYIESSYGFKLHLSYFDEFKKTHEWMKSLTRDWWNIYKEGKIQYKALKQAEKDKTPYEIANFKAYNLYKENSYKISQYFKKRSEYFKIALNNPTQQMAALQTKAATNKIFEIIWKNNHFWDVRIPLVVHDEIALETKHQYTEQYKVILENTMKSEGNKFLSNPVLQMNCESKVATNWYDAK